MPVKTVKRVLEAHVKGLEMMSDEEMCRSISLSHSTGDMYEKYGRYMEAMNLKPCYANLARAIKGDENLFIYIQDGVLKIDAVTFGGKDGD